MDDSEGRLVLALLFGRGVVEVEVSRLLPITTSAATLKVSVLPPKENNAYASYVPR